MDYLKIFDEVVSIMHKDYSGCMDKKDWDYPDLFRQKLIQLQKEEKINTESFQEIIQDYLLDFKDGHVFFRLIDGNQKLYDNGFKCRRYGGKLYITESSSETRFGKGTAITTLNDIPIPELMDKHKRSLELYGCGEDREIWDSVIAKYDRCSIVTPQGEVQQLDLCKYEAVPYVPQYTLTELDKDTLLMKLTDFSNDDAIAKLIADNENCLNNCKNLIIDVRLNRGGSDSAFMKLLDYIFSRKTSLEELDDEYPMLTNVTERNYRLRMDSIRDYLSLISDTQSIHFLNVFIRELDKHKNAAGFVELDISDAIPEQIINGKEHPKNIVVLADLYCGSSGDAFVELASLSEKTIVIGRGTAGITDYSNLCIQNLENTFRLIYPTSRATRIAHGKGLSGKGVQPDIYIPWTPEHIVKDIDLEKALEYLQNK